MTFSRKARRELFWILLFLCCLPLMYALVLGDGGFVQLRKHRKELLELQLLNARLKEEYHSHLRKIEKLKTDPHEIERIAREQYNLARPGDIIVNLQDQQ